MDFALIVNVFTTRPERSVRTMFFVWFSPEALSNILMIPLLGLGAILYPAFVLSEIPSGTSTELLKLNASSITPESKA